MSNNNDLDPAASTQMFQAFVDRGKAGAPTSVEGMPVRTRSYGSSGSSGNSGGSAKVIGIVVALVVVVAVVAFVALHK